ncbi:hypothetical protein [Sphingobium ummariense]
MSASARHIVANVAGRTEGRQSSRMNPARVFGMIASLFLLMPAAHAQVLPDAPKVGDTYEITMTQDSSQQGSNGSSGSSHNKDTIIERVTGLRADGLELEYDLPKSSTADEKASNWQFPARVFKPLRGPPELLNGEELETRLDGWLKAAGWPRAVCGHWIFTWNAFRIECDPQSVLKTIDAFDLRSADLREGAAYQDASALATGTLVRKTSGADGATYSVEMPVDPDAVRRAHAETDVATGEILNKPLTLDAALQARAKEDISGTISVVFETDQHGNVLRRTKVTKLKITKADGSSESDSTTQTLERRLVPGTAK